MYRHILVALDGHRQSERILGWVRPLAQESEARVQLLMVYAPMQTVIMGRRIIGYGHQLEDQADMAARAYLRAIALRLRKDRIAVAWEVQRGDQVDTILDVARCTGVDLIAIATRGAVGMRRLTHRSVTAEVLRRAPVPVLLGRYRDQRAA
jgi:nucleotide-binding universal stress UspA family protein